MTSHSLDTKGLLCPMPVIRTQGRIAELSTGDELEVLATDPGALHDIPAWCRVHGHSYLGETRSTDADGNEVLHIRVRVN